MLIKEMGIKGVFEIDLEPLEDQRGFFMRTYDAEVFKNCGLHENWVQENHSYSKNRGTLRGLHFQFPPNAETKLVRVVGGEIYMAFVDLRRGSTTIGKWDSLILSGDNKKMLYVPRGLALGMCTLTDDCSILYKMDNYYVPESQGLIKWDDPEIGINWPVSNPVLNERDSRASSLRMFIEKHGRLEI
jgi:dTDP-4-dehydrorhamnose 3,5-epimerase